MPYLHDAVKEKKRKWCDHLAQMPQDTLSEVALNYRPKVRKYGDWMRKCWILEWA